MKITITYDKSKDKFYFNFGDKTLETFYGFFAACEKLCGLLHNEFTMAESILDQVQNNNFGITIEV